jgi:hypothetical protein
LYSKPPSIGSFLDSDVSISSNSANGEGVDTADFDSSGEASGNSSLSYSEPGYSGNIDYRIRQLSYSSILTLHECPRKYELYKKRASHQDLIGTSEKSSITFAFGHTVGAGIADIMVGLSMDEVIWKAFLTWEVDLFAEDAKACKSFWAAILALKRLEALRNSGFLSDYEVVIHDGNPAVELSFAISFPDGFRYRGHVDVVLKHRVTGAIVVLECKTTSAASVNPATYKNSAQAIGYSIVLDSVASDVNGYTVYYLIYSTKAGTWEILAFDKNYSQRALWIRELLLDIETIKMYEEAEIYPMRGESCFNWYRECEYFNVCQLSTERLTKPMKQEFVDKTQYQIELTLAQLLETQFSKTTDFGEL